MVEALIIFVIVWTAICLTLTGSQRETIKTVERLEKEYPSSFNENYRLNSLSYLSHFFRLFTFRFGYLEWYK